MGPLFDKLIEHLKAEDNIALATIIGKEGSTPRGVGAKMIVRHDGTINGTIGGGKVEASIIETAKAILTTGGATICEFDLRSSGTIDRMDLICGGQLSILIERIDSTPENIDLYQKAWHKHVRGEKGCMVTGLGPVNSQLQHTNHFLVEELKDKLNKDILGQAPVEVFWERSKKMRAPNVLNIAGKRFLVEPFSPQGTVYLFGAGHVSQKVADLAAMVDFHTVVLDDRPEFANKLRFPTASQVHVINRFEGSLRQLERLGPDSYVVIVTRGHRHDKTVLAQALKSKAAYIGMIGSRIKVQATYQALIDEGFSEMDFMRVNSPIGISIGAQTPAEIAVSIVAELIAKRAERLAL